MNHLKTLVYVIVSGLWGLWIGAVSIVYVLDHQAGAGESPGVLIYFIIPAAIASVIIFLLLQKYPNTKIVPAILIIIPFVLSFLVPTLSGWRSANAFYLNKAIITNNESYCTRIGLNSGKTTCFSTLAKNKGDYRICDNIIFDDPHRQCYIDISFQKNDPAICAFLPERPEDSNMYGDRKYKSNCYEHFAKDDPKLCEYTVDKISCAAYARSTDFGDKVNYSISKCNHDPNNKDSGNGLCFYGEAHANNYPALCNYITYSFQQYSKKYCLDSFK